MNHLIVGQQVPDTDIIVVVVREAMQGNAHPTPGTPLRGVVSNIQHMTRQKSLVAFIDIQLVNEVNPIYVILLTY